MKVIVDNYCRPMCSCTVHNGAECPKECLNIEWIDKFIEKFVDSVDFRCIRNLKATVSNDTGGLFRIEFVRRGKK